MAKAFEIQAIKGIIDLVALDFPVGINVSTGHSYKVSYEEVSDSDKLTYVAREQGGTFVAKSTDSKTLATILVNRK